MNELIKLTKTEIGNELIQAVNARDLHEFLESKQDFSTWIKNRIEKYGFVENQDFIKLHKKMELSKTGQAAQKCTSCTTCTNPQLTATQAAQKF